MAELTVTRRSVNSMGSLKREIGEVTTVAATGSEIKTKLGRIIWAQLISIHSASGDRSGPWYINSATASTTQDDPGVIHIDNTGDGFAAGAYLYEAIGHG